MGSLMTIAMLEMMVAMMGGMMVAGAWAFVRRVKRHRDD